MGPIRLTALQRRNGSLVDRSTTHGCPLFGRILSQVTFGTSSAGLLISSDWHFQERKHFLLGFGKIRGKDDRLIVHRDFVSFDISKEPGNVEHGGRLARSVLWIDGKGADPFFPHCLTQLSLDQGCHHECHHVNVKEGYHPFWIFEVNRSYLLVGFELGMPFLEKWLEFVDFEHLFGRMGFRVQIGDQREYAVGRFLRLHGFLVNRVDDRVNIFPGCYL
jgi:hypothetical protein